MVQRLGVKLLYPDFGQTDAVIGFPRTQNASLISVLANVYHIVALEIFWISVILGLWVLFCVVLRPSDL